MSNIDIRCRGCQGKCYKNLGYDNDKGILISCPCENCLVKAICTTTCKAFEEFLLEKKSVIKIVLGRQGG